MSAPLMPSPLDFIGRKKFAFYPPIRNVSANSWMLGASSWGEVQVINAQTGCDLWVPRQYIGAVSDTSDCLIVGLTQNMDLRNGEIVPSQNRRVIEMPLPKESAFARGCNGPANVIGIRLEQKTASTFRRPSFRVVVFLLFVAGLLTLVASATR